MKLNIKPTAPRLLDWYDRHRRHLPWRFAPGEKANPYWVWLSEIMLQQTTVITVGPYFNNFITKWPTVEGLAASPLDDILTNWAGLGYYARARNLHKCAAIIAADYNGTFPDSMTELLKLPGIGPYTAAAISAIAFQKPEPVMDGNVERVISRLFRFEGQLPNDKPKFYELTTRQTPAQRAGDYAQAMMDLGATICTPKKPKCTICPLNTLCKGQDIADSLPRKAPKVAKPTRRGTAFLITNDHGQILLRRRPEKGLLGKMTEIPGTDWSTGDKLSIEGILKSSPIELDHWREAPGHVRHTFTHFHLELAILTANITSRVAIKDCYWQFIDKLDKEALPTLMQKAIKHGLQAKYTK